MDIEDFNNAFSIETDDRFGYAVVGWTLRGDSIILFQGHRKACEVHIERLRGVLLSWR